MKQKTLYDSPLLQIHPFFQRKMLCGSSFEVSTNNYEREEIELD